MPKGGVPRTGVTDEEIIAETVARVDDSEEGPRTSQEGPGMGWECDADSVGVDKCCELVMGQCHTIVEIQQHRVERKAIPMKDIRCFPIDQQTLQRVLRFLYDN